MAQRCGEVYFIPVFGGDFNRHLVVHAQRKGDDDFMTHVAHMAKVDMEGKISALRYICYLLEQTLAAASGDEAGKQLRPVVQTQSYVSQLCFTTR